MNYESELSALKHQARLAKQAKDIEAFREATSPPSRKRASLLYDKLKQAYYESELSILALHGKSINTNSELY